MFPSLTLLKRIFNGPILRNDIAYLRAHTRNHNPWLRRAGYVLVAFASIMASLPLWIYITDDFPTYLLLPPMVVAIYGVQLVVSAHTLILATHIANRERQTGTWDSLVLTGIDARQILLSKWLAVMLQVWPGHVLAALLRSGLAYGLVQLFDVINFGGCAKYFSAPLCYFSYPWGRMDGALPSLPLILLSFVVLVIFGLLEAGLLVALGSFGAWSTQEHRNAAVAIGATIRVVLMLVVAYSWQLINYYGSPISNRIIEPYIIPYASNQVWGVPYRFSSSLYSATVELTYAAQLTLSTVADNGTVIITDLMRPNAPPIHVLRRLAAISYGLGLYFVLILLLLQLTKRFLVRRGALYPPNL